MTSQPKQNKWEEEWKKDVERIIELTIDEIIKKMPEEKKYKCITTKIDEDGNNDKYHFVGHSQTKGFNEARQQIMDLLDNLKKEEIEDDYCPEDSEDIYPK